MFLPVGLRSDLPFFFWGGGFWLKNVLGDAQASTHRSLSSSLLGLPYRMLVKIIKRNYLGAYG